MIAGFRIRKKGRVQRMMMTRNVKLWMNPLCPNRMDRGLETKNNALPMMLWVESMSGSIEKNIMTKRCHKDKVKLKKLNITIFKNMLMLA